MKMDYWYKDQAIDGNVLIRPYFAVGRFYYKEPSDKAKVDWPAFFKSTHPIGDWLPIPAYDNPANLVQVSVKPQDPKILEGQDFKFNGIILPKSGMGTGEISPTGNTLDLLSGYKAQAGAKIEWTALLQPRLTVWKADAGFEFEFEPKSGTGTYEIIASPTVPLKEKDTSSTAQATGISSTTALVEPGLKILTPIKEFAYPVGMPIKVTTTLDGKPAWGNISWTLNGKPWIPTQKEPPAFFTPDQEGQWTLIASATLISDGNDVPVQDQVTFQVKPVSFQLSPARKIVSPLPAEVSWVLAARLGASDTSAIDSPVVWVPKLMQAEVKSVTWKGFTSPTTGDDLLGPDPFARKLTLKTEGPMTVLATVTVRFWSIDPQKPFDETFDFPAPRADVWGFDPPFWNPLKSTLPDEKWV
jgi:hypothetical protein